MSATNNISLFVPHVFPNFTQKYVAEAFDDLGDVERVDFVAKQDRDGKPFNAAYVHFNSWHNTNFADNTRNVIERNGSTKFYHDKSEYYWIVLPNTAKKHVPGERKPRLDTGDSKAINIKSIEKTPEKPVKEAVCPGAPKKPTYSQIATKSVVDKAVVDKSAAATKPVVDKSVATEPVADKHSKLEAEFEEWYAKLESDVEFMSEEELQMAEIQAELDAEDENLISIDHRYVQSIEQENFWLHGEVAQLRMALINLDQMYQAEAAKVRAIASKITEFEMNH